ncbi:MAG: hypothetical protein LAP21_28075 [Acidobacteriia bacterium]|nr:hypothetical protein [Terriglobia bacterium]
MFRDSAVKRKREVSAEDFRRLLTRFDPDPLKAWQAYDSLRRKLVMFFEPHRGLDAEALAAEALERIARKSDSVEIANIAEFAFGVARNLRREALRKVAATSRLSELGGDEHPAAGTEGSEQALLGRMDAQHKVRCFVECMKALDSRDRRLLLMYYPPQEDDLEERRRQLAVSLNMTLSALRTRVARLREKLERCFQNCRARNTDEKAK